MAWFWLCWLRKEGGKLFYWKKGFFGETSQNCYFCSLQNFGELSWNLNRMWEPRGVNDELPDLWRSSRLTWSHKLFVLLGLRKITNRMAFGKESWIMHQRSGSSRQCGWIYLQFVIKKLYISRLEKGGGSRDKNKDRMSEIIVKSN